jgi:hypothetical protein
MFVTQVVAGLTHVVVTALVLWRLDFFGLRVLVEAGCPHSGFVLSDGDNDECIGVVRHEHLLSSDSRPLYETGS